jgi:hypothetical protein
MRAKQALALPHSQVDVVALAQVLSQQFPVPQGLGKPDVARVAPHIALQATPLPIAQTARAPRPLTVLQPGKASFLALIAPALHGAITFVEPLCGLACAPAVGHQQDAVQPVIVSRLVVAANLLAYCDSHPLGSTDRTLAHHGTSDWILRFHMYTARIRHYL